MTRPFISIFPLPVPPGRVGLADEAFEAVALPLETVLEPAVSDASAWGSDAALELSDWAESADSVEPDTVEELAASPEEAGVPPQPLICTHKKQARKNAMALLPF